MSVPERRDAAGAARRRGEAAPEATTEAERRPGTSGRRTIHPIEARSYAILRSRVDLSGLPPLRRAVTERVIHASADLEYATDLVAGEADLERGLRALRAGAPVVTDVAMVAAGITRRETVCSITDPAAARTAAATGLTRSAAAVRVAYARVGPGAVWVVGCAPTALEEIIAFGVEPALVIGLPVGFVGAAESKAALRASGLPAVSNVSEKGGSAVAAAALNALLYYAGDTDPPPVSEPAERDGAGPARVRAVRSTGTRDRPPGGPAPAAGAAPAPGRPAEPARDLGTPDAREAAGPAGDRGTRSSGAGEARPCGPPPEPGDARGHGNDPADGDEEDDG